MLPTHGLVSGLVYVGESVIVPLFSDVTSRVKDGTLYDLLKAAIPFTIIIFFLRNISQGKISCDWVLTPAMGIINH